MLTAVAVVLVLILGACTKSKTATPNPARSTASSTASSTSTAPTASTSSAPAFAFSNCTGQLQTAIDTDRAKQMTFSCGKLAVPLDYAMPAGKTIDLFVVKMHLNRQKPADRLGSLLVNPGGPGVSGVPYAASLVGALDLSVLEHFDLIGFDPRGVGLSTPLECISDKQKDAVTAQDADVATAAGRASAKSLATAITKACVSKYGAGLKHYNTEETARDLDRIRQALGDEKLNYLGVSYGTRLGAAYAHFFPSKLRVAVLDGPLDPITPELSIDERQAKGFEDSFDEFAAACPKRRSCAALSNPRATVQSLIKAADRSPLKSSRAGETRRASGGVIIIAVAYALYDPAEWDPLAKALLAARSGDAAQLFTLADRYAERDPTTGRYTTNVLDANTIINCNDSTLQVTDALVAAKAREWSAKYPIFGNNAAASLYNCYGWPKSGHPVPPASAPGAPPILVVATLHDPATPYPAAPLLAKALGTGVVLTWDGEGHGAYLRTKCVTAAVNNYLIQRTVPKASCPAS